MIGRIGKEEGEPGLITGLETGFDVSNLNALVSLENHFLDSAEIETTANKCMFVWKKPIEANKAKLQDRVSVTRTRSTVSTNKKAGLPEALQESDGSLQRTQRLLEGQHGCNVNEHESRPHAKRPVESRL
ncbi:hypothetical protein [Eggerthella sinensis]|uniref:hypothetical protein n=1 Tax=Eggerthella sinensis TaxID=242230 RepID=UPI00248F1685|nr:hypothetical protein [Eggerthella sinensis]